jgi:ABC transporter substrate binding protein
LAYGVDLADNFRRAATYVDRIIKGEKPSELPVQAPVKFELVINLKTAKAWLCGPGDVVGGGRQGDKSAVCRDAYVASWPKREVPSALSNG